MESPRVLSYEGKKGLRKEVFISVGGETSLQEEGGGLS